MKKNVYIINVFPNFENFDEFWDCITEIGNVGMFQKNIILLSKNEVNDVKKHLSKNKRVNCKLDVLKFKNNSNDMFAIMEVENYQNTISTQSAREWISFEMIRDEVKSIQEEVNTRTMAMNSILDEAIKLTKKEDNCINVETESEATTSIS